MTDAGLGDDWKVQLRYGRISTPFKHYALVADGTAGQLAEGFECRPGPAVMAMKGWATDPDEAVDMIRYVSEQIGFSIAEKIEVYEAELDEPPRERPFAYNISFVPYSDGSDSDE